MQRVVCVVATSGLLLCLLAGGAGAAPLADGCLEYLTTQGMTCTFNCTTSSNDQCVGCDKNPPNNGYVLYDNCGVCGGSNNECTGCDGGTGSYDVCGVCNGNSSCLDQPQLTEPTFDPPGTAVSGQLYFPPVLVKIIPPSDDCTVYYKIRDNDVAEQNDFVPPNRFSPNGIASIESPLILNITTNVTIEAFVGKPGFPQSYVAQAIFSLSLTPPTSAPSQLILPIYGIVLIAVGGAIIVGILVWLYFRWRVQKRKDLIQINLDSTEKEAKLDHYKAKFDYNRQNYDELDLKVGDVIAVLQKHDDGWWEGRSYRLKGKRGVFPGDYVEPVPAERLIWVERPKTMFGRMSQRVSQFFAGGPTYGTDPQAPQNTRTIGNRVSRAFGFGGPLKGNSSTSALPMLQTRTSVAPPEQPSPSKKPGFLPPKPGAKPSNSNPLIAQQDEW